ncbi:MAG TPA: WecB/TagA/CpsF family glycosyltransferase, partial [Solirubrobacteraceae bacterium]|nr:WecB/TagA/CpsF family glycosyltransferase [Solirubrobacteraceae bacterium]
PDYGPAAGNTLAETRDQAGRDGFERVELLGLPLAVISERQMIDHVISEVAAGRGGWICTMHLDMLRQWRRSAEVRGLVSSIDILVADGMPLVWACALRGTPLPERVPGSTLTVSLTEAAAAAGNSVFLLGGKPGTAERAARELKRRYPELRLAGTLCPPLGFENEPDYLDLIKSTLRDAAPDIVFVALGFPKQDRLILELRPILPNAWLMGCGISFSLIAGELRRAPRLFQMLGLEWVFRLVQEPRRLFRRYMVQGIPFGVVLMWRSLLDRFSSATAQEGVPPPQLDD